MNVLIISGFIAAVFFFIFPVIGLIIYTRKRNWTQKRIILISIFFLFSILINPFAQLIYLEPLDTKLNYQWRDKAQKINIIGKTPDQIKNLYGKPIRQWSETPRTIDKNGEITWEGQFYTCWEYQPLMFYWLGSRFQIFFQNGKVTGFEANDD